MKKKKIKNSKRLEILYRIKKLREEYKEACKQIADQCEEEGYPSHGYNYELRCESEWEIVYAPQIDALYTMLNI